MTSLANATFYFRSETTALNTPLMPKGQKQPTKIEEEEDDYDINSQKSVEDEDDQDQEYNLIYSHQSRVNPFIDLNWPLHNT